MGPLKGLKIVEMAGLGPGPFAGMMLADMGAEVILVERRASEMKMPDANRRGKKSIALNLKEQSDVSKLLTLIESCDALFEGFRPGVMERLGLGPEVCMQRNPKLIYARMTGWGQDGPLAKAAGHDINYIALTGALHGIGRNGEKPVPPLNLVGDYGGGGMFLVTGILAAYIEAQRSGQGQVVDVAMTDGTAVLMSIFNTLHGVGMHTTNQGTNMLDTGAHYYDTYETKDGKYISIGAIEPQFYKLLLEKAGLDLEEFKAQNNQKKWPEFKQKFEVLFKTKTREEWCVLMEGTDICFAPVLDLIEAQSHAHNIARKTYINVDGIMQPAPAPKFARTPSEVTTGSPMPGEHTSIVLGDQLT